MKFCVTMKTPDALDEAIQEIVQSDMVCEMGDGDDANKLLDMIDEDECEDRIRAVKNICASWFQYEDYLTVEIDTEAKTCVVVPNDTGLEEEG